MDANFILMVVVLLIPRMAISQSKIIFIVLDCLLCIMIAVAIFPHGNFVSSLGGNASFTCYPTRDDLVVEQMVWLLNGSIFEDRPDVTPDVTSDFGSDVQAGTLKFINLSSTYNTTRVQCRAELASGELLISNDPTLLLIQGLNDEPYHAH